MTQVFTPNNSAGYCTKCNRGYAFGPHVCPEATPESSPRRKANYIGAPACFLLEQACQHVAAAFGGYGLYQVGSSLERPDWRDVDLRFILDDEEFARLFPDAGEHWEFDPRWLLLTTSISARLSQQTGLPIDFQFQPMSHANKRHNKPRNAVGLRIAKSSQDSQA
jgi:hypothetical protein